MPAIKANGDSRILMTGIGKLPTHDLNPQKEKSGPYRDFAAFAFEKKIDHVIAIRYANYSAATFHGADYEAGFYLFLGCADVAIERAANELRADSSFQMFFTALFLLGL